jgi:hypothetical protein
LKLRNDEIKNIIEILNKISLLGLLQVPKREAMAVPF